MDSHRARDDLDDFMDAIDLTFSSPEPEPQPRAIPTPGGVSRPTPRSATRPLSTQPVQSQQSTQARQSTQQPRHPPVPAHVSTPINRHSGIQVGSGYNTHPRAGHRNHASTPAQHSRQTASHSNNASQHDRHINPHHLARILESCDVRAIRHVLLNLCKTSPALSGAVARGLAPYSVFAQAIIKNQQRGAQHASVKSERSGAAAGMASTQSSSVKTERNNDALESISRERFEQATGASSSARPGSVSSSARIHTPARRRADGTRISAPYTAHSVRERREGSSTDSDDSNHIVSIASSRSRENRTPLQPSSSKANHTARSFTLPQASLTTASSGDRTLTCARCNRSYIEGQSKPGNCAYHPGTRVVTVDDEVVLSCCWQPPWQHGCASADHLSKEAAAASPLTQSQPSASNPYEQTNKRRKI